MLFPCPPPSFYRRQSGRVVEAQSEFARRYHLELFTWVYIVESEKVAKGEGKREEEQWQSQCVCAGRHTYSHSGFFAFLFPFFYNRQLFRFLVSDLTCLSRACGQGDKSLRRYTNLLRRYTNDACITNKLAIQTVLFDKLYLHQFCSNCQTFCTVL